MKLKKLLLILMSVVMVLTTATVALVNVFAEDEVAAVIDTDGTSVVQEYATLDEALAAATAGQTVKLLTDITGYTANVVPVKDGITIDGDNHSISHSTSTYMWAITGSVTIKNLTVTTDKGGFRWFDANDSKTSVLTLDNVSWTVKANLFCNIGGDTSTAVNPGDAIDGVDMRMNVINGSEIMKYCTSNSGEPLMATYSNATEGDIEINLTNSVFSHSSPSSSGVADAAMFKFNNGTSIKLNVNDGGKIYFNPGKTNSSSTHGNRAVIGGGKTAATTVTLNSGSEIVYGAYKPEQEIAPGTLNMLYFSDNNKATVTDNGCTWTITDWILEHNDKTNKTDTPNDVATYVADITVSLPDTGKYAVKGADCNYVTTFSSRNLKLFSTHIYPSTSFVKVDEETKVAAIGNDEYDTLAAAIDAATEGQTIKLLTNVAESLANKSPANNVTINGANFAYHNLAENKYIFNVTNKDLTIKNIKITSGRLAKSVMTDDTTNDATVGTHHLTLNNVTATINKDAMLNMSGDYYGEHVLNIVNCNLTQLTNNQPMIVTYPNSESNDNRSVIINISNNSTLTAKNNVPVIWAHAYGEFDGNAELTVNVATSTISQLGGAVNNLAMSSIIRADAVGCAVMNVNLNASAKLVLNPIAATSGAHRAMISSQAAETNVTLDDAATVEFGSKTEKNYGTITHMYLIYNEGDFAQHWNDYTDNGAEWIVNEYAPKVIMPNVAGYVAITSNEGAIARPSAIGTAGTYTKANLVELGLTNGTGASIKLPADNSEKASIRFVAEVDAEFKALLGASATYTSRVTKTSYLENANGDFKALDAEYYVDAPAVKWLDDTTFGVALTNIPDYNTDYAVTSYVTITYTDGTTATFWAEFDDAANARSVAEVAQKALDSGRFTQYTDGLNAIIEAASGNS